MAAFAAPIIGAVLPFLLQKLFSGQQGGQSGGQAGGGNFFTGQPGRIEAVPTGTPGQQDLISQLLSGLSGQGGPISQGIGNISQLLSGSPEAFQAFEAPALRQFHEQIVPKIAERFTGGLGVPGAESAQGSSAFAQTLGQAGAGLAETLSSQRAGLQSGAMDQLLRFLNISQEPQFKPTAIEGRPGFGQGLFNVGGQILGNVGSQFISKKLGLS